MAYDETLASRVRAALAAQPGLEEKKMFGGMSFMISGQMCCGVLKDDLIVRIGSDVFDDALAQPHVRPFDFTGRPSTGMVYVGPGGVSTDQALQAWVQRGIDYVRAHPRASKRAARRS